MTELCEMSELKLESFSFTAFSNIQSKFLFLQLIESNY